MSDEADDRLMRHLRRLPVLEPAPERSARVRTYYHVALTRRQQAAAHSNRFARVTAFALESVLVGGLCLMYLTAVIQNVLRLRDIH
jgi:hypothetical protein